ncbi:MAG: hypothetical protein ACLFWM_01315 [Actinomycetota bacterium]
MEAPGTVDDAAGGWVTEVTGEARDVEVVIDVDVASGMVVVVVAAGWRPQAASNRATAATTSSLNDSDR